MSPPRVSRQALIAAASTFLLFVIIAAAAFEPFVRSQASRRAEARGLSVQIGNVDLGWGGVWLKDVSVSAPAAPALKVELQAIFVPFGSAALEAHGGDVMLSGNYAEVSEQLARLRRPAATSAAASEGREYLLDGLRLSWSGLLPDRSVQRVWGLGYRRGGQGGEQVTADLVKLHGEAFSFELGGLDAEFARSGTGRKLSKMRAESAAFELDASRLWSSRSKAEAAPATTAASATPQAAKLPLLLSSLTTRAGDALAENATIQSSATRLRLHLEGDTLNFGPSRLSIERKLGALLATLEQGQIAPGTTPLSLRAKLPLGAGEPEIDLEGGPISLAALGVREGDFGLFDVRRANLEAHTRLTLRLAERRVRLSGRGELRDVSLARRALSPAPLAGIRVAWRGTADAALDGSEVEVEDAELAIGEVHLHASGIVQRNPDFLRIKAEGGVPLAACEKLLESMPQGFAPTLAGLRMSGTFAAALAIDADTRRLDRMKVELDVENACVITHVPEQLLPARFRAPWTRTVRGGDGQPLVLNSGPGSGNWVRYDDISKYMEIAVLVCEDGGFYRHRGFDYGAIEKSIQDNVRAGRFMRGGSTISMQLARNLYLGREKNLSRKFEEAILTMLIEQQFEKRELMELYLNVIEFGPGIYGIGPAARHYFDLEPDRLTLGQALYLASILPSPDQQHFDESGAVSERWTKYLQKLMHIAYKVSRISDEELAAGLEEQVAFRVPGSEPPAFSEEPPPPAPPGGE